MSEKSSSGTINNKQTNKQTNTGYVLDSSLYNVEVTYASQLRHLSNKTQNGSITRKSHIKIWIFHLSVRLFYILLLDLPLAVNDTLCVPSNWTIRSLELQFVPSN